MSVFDQIRELDLIDKRSAFGEVHLLKAFLLLEEEPIGRMKLMDELGLSEASTRTLLKRLRESGLVETSTKGHRLTEKGRKIANNLAYKLSGPFFLESSELTVGESNVCVAVSDASSKINDGIEQRDAAVKAGAEGATTVKHENEKLQLMGEKVDLPEKVKGKLNLEDGDVLIIGSGKTKKEAEEGSLAAALTLI
ncbi:MAG: DUF4443 domain-containing protein [Candidatus Aenigmatarchaeota archaeon]